jgi:hypothetical protein
MTPIQHFTDKVDRIGYISKKGILEKVTQEEIFQLVFGFLPEESQYVVSPLREDGTPGAWFSYHINGVLYFVDFGANPTHRDCFSMVQTYFKFPNFYLTLEYIYQKLIQGNEDKLKKIVIENKIVTEKPKVRILIEARPFNINDQIFWTKYEVTKSQLVEDKVFAIRKFYALNTKAGNIIADCNDLAYSYNDFSNSKKKVYFPQREGKRRFLTNCSKDDVGGINSLMTYGKELIITKSYKDYRVLKNNGKNVVWFQNEGMIPNDNIIKMLINNFSKILVWYDNDSVGIESSEKVKNHINSFVSSKAKNLWLPERALELGIKDPSDCIEKDKNLFHNFLKDFTL